MTILSFYYGLFKKFRSLGHAAEGTFHGTVPGGSSGVDLSSPNLLLAGSHNGVPLIDPVGTSPSQSPLWMVLNARAAHAHLRALVQAQPSPRLHAAAREPLRHVQGPIFWITSSSCSATRRTKSTSRTSAHTFCRSRSASNTTSSSSARVGTAEVSVVHRATIPVFGKKRCCYEIETVTIGGFTLETRFHAPKKHAHG